MEGAASFKDSKSFSRKREKRVVGRNCHRLCGAEKLKKSPRNGETARDFINVLVLSEACQFKAQFTSNITVIIREDSVTRTDFSESQAQSEIKKHSRTRTYFRPLCQWINSMSAILGRKIFLLCSL